MCPFQSTFSSWLHSSASVQSTYFIRHTSQTQQSVSCTRAQQQSLYVPVSLCTMSLCTYVSMYLCLLCLYVPTSLCLYVAMYLRLYVPMSLCLYVPMSLVSLCNYVSVSLCTYISMYLCLCVSMYLCPCVSMYLLINVNIWTTLLHCHGRPRIITHRLPHQTGGSASHGVRSQRCTKDVHYSGARCSTSNWSTKHNYLTLTKLNPLLSELRPHSTSWTSSKLVGNLNWQPGFPTSLQLVLVRNFFSFLVGWQPDRSITTCRDRSIRLPTILTGW